ncbi:uncharacterized protein CTRU02_203256 [Colletotrichum truncatum]|uniref:Uncharacterized protein n=1 Tax=Colletotrichum truncatum TaxID=5467 RepID=A0ACC3Z8S0_COLTU|nr:uncharacterized protein CTRU02_09097 [Colletotrichum truncatum]KAF6789305.1 hypothetical protein CTRU02_09097 [Colletotrichum truncatum]
MVDVNERFATRLQRESWSLYTVGILIISLRLYGQARRLGGLRNYQADDYLQLVAVGFYTVLVATLNIITDNGGSNLFLPEDLPTFTESDVRNRIENSKYVLVSEQAMLNVIYVLKACVLILYTRLTLGLAAKRIVRFLAIYVAVGWTASQIAMFASCQPFKGYWAVPPPDPQCATYEHYAIVQACFNISSDVFMMMVPLPLIFKMSTAWRQKVVLVFIFGLGICIIIAAMLTKIYNLEDPYSPRYMLWYIREASVAVYVSNLPLIWPLLREWFPWLRGLKTAGVLPTPHPGRGKRERESNFNRSSAAGDRSQVATRNQSAVASARRDTFADFGNWLRAGDLDIPKPPRVVLASPSRECILEELEEKSASPSTVRTVDRKRRSTLSGTLVEEVHDGSSSLRRQTMDLDLERGDLVWDHQEHHRKK